MDSSHLILIGLMALIYFGLGDTRDELTKTKKRLAKLEVDFHLYKTNEYGRIKKVTDDLMRELLERANK